MVGFDFIARGGTGAHRSTARGPVVGRGVAVALISVVLNTTVMARAALAQGGQCTQACQSAYAQCEAKLQQCLSTCINKR